MAEQTPGWIIKEPQGWMGHYVARCERCWTLAPLKSGVSAPTRSGLESAMAAHKHARKPAQRKSAAERSLALHYGCYGE